MAGGGKRLLQQVRLSERPARERRRLRSRRVAQADLGVTVLQLGNNLLRR
jgi:hypothetical protein